MIIAKRLKGKAIAAWLGPTGDAARRAVAGIRQQWTKDVASRLDVYLDPADPWSYLTAQAASRLVERYPVELAVHIVTPPASDVDPQPGMRTKHALRDALMLADYWDIEFAGKKEADPGVVRDVASALIRERAARDQLRAFLELTSAMWSGDKKQVTKLLGTWGTESTGAIAPILSSNYEALRKAGHYQSAMIRYGSEWYWGIDRLPFLEAALARDAGSDVANVIMPRPASDRGALPLLDEPTPGKPAPELRCEMWFSFRSPYSYLALEQIEATLAPFGVPLQARPIYPMVMRGLDMPTVKRLYIVRDVKREADRKGIPFGQLCDPLGPGIENCIALAYWAERRGALVPLARSLMRGIWSEARDVTEYVDLRYMVERADLSWGEAREALATPEATKWAQANAADLAVIGLWGVPSYRCGNFVAWGQDRLPLLADRLRRHRLQVPS
jgi:2-hydroxychromene-2-carboxylate isomerase